MATQLSVIGLGRIGLSMGLALQDNSQEIIRIGADIELSAEQRANKLKAFDRCVHNISDAVKDADVVMLCVPVDQVEALLEIIKDDLKPGAVVIDTSPVTVPILEWATQNLPADRHLLKFIPSLNPEHIQTVEMDPEKACADLFYHTTILVSALPETHPDALRLAGDLVALLGAHPLYTDPYEADGLIAMANLLPTLSALALMRTVNSQPGWRESQKIASSEFSTATQALLAQVSQRQPGLDTLMNSENTARLLGDLITELKTLQAMIAGKDAEAVHKAFKEATENRSQWTAARKEAKWARMEQIDVPTTKQSLLGIFNPAKRKKDTSTKN